MRRRNIQQWGWGIQRRYGFLFNLHDHDNCCHLEIVCLLSCCWRGFLYCASCSICEVCSSFQPFLNLFWMLVLYMPVNPSAHDALISSDRSAECRSNHKSLFKCQPWAVKRVFCTNRLSLLRKYETRLPSFSALEQIWLHDHVQGRKQILLSTRRWFWALLNLFAQHRLQRSARLPIQHQCIDKVQRKWFQIWCSVKDDVELSSEKFMKCSCNKIIYVCTEMFLLSREHLRSHISVFQPFLGLVTEDSPSSAIPQSSTYTSSCSPIMILSGLISLWMIPWSCAWVSALHTLIILMACIVNHHKERTLLMFVLWCISYALQWWRHFDFVFRRSVHSGGEFSCDICFMKEKFLCRGW